MSASTIPASFRPSTAIGDTAVTENRPSNGNPTSLDPYARAFVRYALTSINTLNGRVVNTVPLRGFNFDSYVLQHVGLAFLPPIPFLQDIPVTGEFVLADHAFPSHYAAYFRFHIDAEMYAQDTENDGYALYEHDVTVLSLQENEEATACFHLPGVRENNPYLEEDDIVQFRQFVYESMAQRGLWYMNNPAITSSTGLVPPISQPRWSGLALNGRITNIQRKDELVYVRILGLNSQQLMVDLLTSSQKQVPCKFNIQFPTMKERYQPMLQVLPVIQWALGQSLPRRVNGSAVPHVHSNPTTPSLPSPVSRNWLLSMLCPIERDCAIQAKLNPGSFKRKFFDSELNWEQQKATDSVCSRNYGTLPFLISGPPGTGKTKTLVEIAVQLMRNEKSHILFCAPSDPAADTLAQRLSSYCKPGELLRLNRTTRTFAEVPNTVMPFCYVDGGTFSVPPFKQLMAYKIVVASVQDTSMLMYARVTNNDLYSQEYGFRNAVHPRGDNSEPVRLHWTALLMDEAAQGIEPQALVPLSIVAPPLEVINLEVTPIFVMAGDEYQLGPRVSLRTSPLKISLFARLFARKVYSDHPLARSKTGKEPPPLSSGMLPIFRPPFANLIRNYRSHPAVLAIPSSLFYADTLEPAATSTDRLAKWSAWQGKRWPVLFHNNLSEDEHEMDGGGWYNKGEVEIACSYALSLVKEGLVQEQEICIMSPFKAQVKRLRNAMRSDRFNGLRGVDIGPTEAFQGLERGVVILCTTRSKERFVKKDQDLGWGIIGMPNKMNVAVTRAKFGLVVIGKKDVLSLDQNWVAFMKFCKRNGLWAGAEVNGPVGGVDGGGGERTRLERVLLGAEEEVVNERRVKALKVWGSAVEDQMWIDGVQAEEDDMGSTDMDDGDSDEDNEFHGGNANGEGEVENGDEQDGIYHEIDVGEEEYEYHESLTGLRGHL